MILPMNYIPLVSHTLDVFSDLLNSMSCILQFTENFFCVCLVPPCNALHCTALLGFQIRLMDFFPLFFLSDLTFQRQQKNCGRYIKYIKLVRFQRLLWMSRNNEPLGTKSTWHILLHRHTPIFPLFFVFYAFACATEI